MIYTCPRRQQGRLFLFRALADACLLLAGAAWAVAGINTWTGNGPDGGDVRILAADPAAQGVLYAGTTAAGVFKSTDGGASWAKANNGISTNSIYGLAVDPADHLTLYAGSLKSLFKSTDGGGSWTAAASGMPANTQVMVFAIDPASHSTVYAGTPKGVYKSTNGGGLWTAAATGLPSNVTVQALVMDPGNPLTLYAGLYSGGVYKSTDGGGNWAAASTGLPSGQVKALAPDPAAGPNMTLYGGVGNGLYKTTDGGGNWLRMDNGVLLNRTVYAVALDSANHSVVYAGTWINGIYKSTDGGGSWSEVNKGLPTYRTVNSLAADPFQTNTVYAGINPRGVSKTIDGGFTWQDANAGLANTQILGLAVDPVDGSVYAAAVYNGAFKNAGSRGDWSKLPVIPSGYDNISSWTFAIDSSTNQLVYLGTGGGFVYRSPDKGATWAYKSSGMTNGYVHVIAFDPGNHSIVYAGTDNGVMRSASMGESWEPTNAGLPGSTAVNALAIDPVDARIQYAGSSVRGVYKRSSVLTDWTQVNTGLTSPYVYALALDPDHHETLYAGTLSGVFKTTDGGLNWAASGLTGQVNALAWDSVNDILNAGTETGVFRSTNRGASWTDVSLNIDDKSIKSLAVDPTDTKRLYAGTAFRGVFGITLVGDPATPIAPTNLKAATVSSTQINLTWADNTGGAATCRIERKSGGGSFSQIATVGKAVTSYSNSGLAAGTSYVYRVQADIDGEVTAYSNEASAATFSRDGNFTIGGYLGVGLDAPERAVHIRGGNAVFRMDRSANTAAFMITRTGTADSVMKSFVVGVNASGTNNGSFVINDLATAITGSGTNRLTIDNTGAAAFGQGVHATGFFTPSARARKTGVRPLEGALETVLGLQGVRFRWQGTGTPSMGFIAEDLAGSIPEFVASRTPAREPVSGRSEDSGVFGLDYNRLTALLVEGVKQQQREIESLQQQRDRLKALLEKLRGLEQVVPGERR